MYLDESVLYFLDKYFVGLALAFDNVGQKLAEHIVYFRNVLYNYTKVIHVDLLCHCP